MQTHSVCPTCYRHIEADLFECEGRIQLRKTCPDHGETTATVENNVEFYYSKQAEPKTGFSSTPYNIVILEATDRCNLACPHCYHIPNNKSKDKSIASILAESSTAPDTFGIVLGGAEPAVRDDLIDVMTEIKTTGRTIGLLTNGVRFSDKDFAKSVVEAGLDAITTLVGLNHKNYHTEAVRNKQMEGLANLQANGIVPMVGYTSNYEELEDIILECIQLYSERKIALVRLRFSANIGRHPDTPFLTLSNHLSKVKAICEKHKFSYIELSPLDNTIYHQMVLINGNIFRIIQWPDETNIAMNELKSGPWAKFYPGPITNFCHQIVMRDGIKNKKLPMLDSPPKEYGPLTF